jgi:hypothetical protein
MDSSVTPGPNHSYSIDEAIFIPVSDAFQDVLSASAFSDGSGTKVLTEPLLLWFSAFGEKIVEETRNSQFIAR